MMLSALLFVVQLEFAGNWYGGETYAVTFARNVETTATAPAAVEANVLLGDVEILPLTVWNWPEGEKEFAVSLALPEVRVGVTARLHWRIRDRESGDILQSGSAPVQLRPPLPASEKANAARPPRLGEVDYLAPECPPETVEFFKWNLERLGFSARGRRQSYRPETPGRWLWILTGATLSRTGAAALKESLASGDFRVEAFDITPELRKALLPELETAVESRVIRLWRMPGDCDVRDPRAAELIASIARNPPDFSAWPEIEQPESLLPEEKGKR